MWRSNPNQNIKTYALTTVTFGTSAAPYLAIKTLYQLADDEEKRFLIGVMCLREAFYVDDFIHGADTISEGMAM